MKEELLHSIFSPISKDSEEVVQGESRLKEYENNGKFTIDLN